jgi:cytoskeletal protein CcmA (bactofilin family)
VALRKKDDEGRPPAGTSLPDRRVSEQGLAHTTEIGPGTFFRGDVSSSDPVEIRGTLEGDCRTSARCIVHEGGRVLGNIDASALIVAGEVEAGLLTAEKVELRATAHVVGTIRARVMVIADGSFYQGEIEDGRAGNPAPIRDRRKG